MHIFCNTQTIQTYHYGRTMKMITPTIVYFALTTLLLHQVVALQSEYDVHLLIYETEVSNDSPVNNLLSQASNIPGLTTTVVGQGKKFDGFGSKYEAILPLIQKMDKDTLVVLSDSRDVLINNPNNGNKHDALQSLQDFRSAFEMVTFQQPDAIVISAEAQCCVSALTYVQPGAYFNNEGQRTARACSSGELDCLWNGDDMAVPWENFMKDVARQRMGSGVSVMDDVYLNSGLMAGKVIDILRVLERADILATEDDQAVLTDYMYQNPQEIILDYGQTMFGNNRGGLEGDSSESCMFKMSTSGSNKLVHTKTDTSPLFVHSPGGFMKCHDDLASQLGVSAISTNARRRLREWKSRTLNYRTCPFGQKSISGFCVQEWCNSDFQCPANSYRIDGRGCYDDFGDCECSGGYYKVNGSCAPVPSPTQCFQCPRNSQQRWDNGYVCKNTMEDCICNGGFKNVNGYCVAHWCTSDFQCPIGRTRIPGRMCYDTVSDCQFI